ncbi:hypothetical protein KQX54_018648 [Cotesia glomerata]|uniref:Uncharacterized protein n=1 Tax=Cotesia glomerata TaxID=32391 RepID=A0AAV7I254_COTGL|nr:hypothetical protein KQX54_018648 [Cotesia glomerata]
MSINYLRTSRRVTLFLSYSSQYRVLKTKEPRQWAVVLSFLPLALRACSLELALDASTVTLSILNSSGLNKASERDYEEDLG